MSGAHIVSKPVDSRKVKRILLGILLAAVLIWATLAIRFIVLYDYQSWITGRRASAAVRNARAVTLSEFVPGAIIAKKEAMPEEIARLRKATRFWYLPFISRNAFLCNEPHHKVVITQDNGAKITVEFCFLCEKFSIPDQELGGNLPPHLKTSLEMFFTSVGMKPKTWKEYSEIERAAGSKQSGEPKL
jgi:hypothetical protein